MVCPYGRMQGVLLDSKSIVVTYDYQRGEPRGPKNDGDCIDCHQCVSVCPTGIDIRNGTQLECINCTACIDQCNKIMQITGKKPGLIRYDSENGIKERHTTIWNARNRAYSVVLLLLFSFFVYSLISRPEIETSILRMPGLLYQEQDNNNISNVYNIKIVNKTHEEMELNIKLLSHQGIIQLAGEKIIVKDQDLYESTMLLLIPRDEIPGDKNEIEFGIYRNNELIETVSTTFIGP
jgi:cytochrome c oxidase accessory protein FixG